MNSARTHGKPRIVWQEYLGTADELVAAMRGGGLGLLDRPSTATRAVAAPGGVLEDLGVGGADRRGGRAAAGQCRRAAGTTGR